MDSGLEERILPSIRRSQILLIYRKGGVVNPETCGQIACSARLSEGWRPYGQDPCEVGRLPIRFTVGTGGTIIDKHRRHDQAARSGGTIGTVGEV